HRTSCPSTATTPEPFQHLLRRRPSMPSQSPSATRWRAVTRAGGVLAWAVLGVALAGSPARAIIVFSTGMTLPESITQAPSGFGAVGGTYLVPDLGGNKIYSVPAGGGAPSVFADTSALGPAPGFSPYGGLF